MSTLAVERTRYLTTTAAALAVSAALPVLVHLLPVTSGLPAGARLLPIFFAPLIAVLIGRPAAALTAALLAPFINHLLTGMPAAATLPVITMQLLIFTGLAVLLRRKSWLVLLAPLAYLAAYYLTPLLLGALALLPGLNGLPAGSVRALPQVLAGAWPGLLALLFVGWALELRHNK